MRPNEIKNIFKAGVFVVFLLAGVVIFTLLLSKEGSIFDKKIQIHTIVKNAQSLKEGAAVRLKGIKIGTIESISINSLSSVIINMKIIYRHATFIKEDSIIEIQTQGVLGDKYIEISGGSEESQTIVDGGKLKIEEGKEFKDFIIKGENILVTVNRVLAKLELLMEGVNKEKNLEQTFAGLNQFTQRINKLLSDKNIKNFGKITTSFAQTGANMSKLSGRISNGPGTAHSLIYDNSVHEDLQHLLGGAQRNKILKYFIRESIKKSEETEK